MPLGAVPDRYRDILESKTLGHLATVDPGGRPQVNPVWFGTQGEYLIFSQTTTRQKDKNLQRDARLALSIVDPDNPYRYLELRGRVVRIDPDPAKAFIDSMAKKYLGVDEYPWNQPGDERIVMVIAVEHTTQMGG
jgi:PPOX class probable F420-dependent enzyme